MWRNGEGIQVGGDNEMGDNNVLRSSNKNFFGLNTFNKQFECKSDKKIVRK